MRVTLNGRTCELDEGASVRAAVVAAGAGDAERGVAVALDGTIVPRSAWDVTTVAAEARIEVLRATAGG